MKTEFNMNQCKPGDRLISCHGMILTYEGINERSTPFRHVVKYPNGGHGTRADNGETYLHNKMAIDHDIIGFAQ